MQSLIKFTFIITLLYIYEPVIENIINIIGLFTIWVSKNITTFTVRLLFFMIILTWIKIFVDIFYMSISKIETIVYLQNIVTGYVNKKLEEHYGFVRLSKILNETINFE